MRSRPVSVFSRGGTTECRGPLIRTLQRLVLGAEKSICKISEDKAMRKTVIDSSDTTVCRSEQWIELDQLATVEITSEDPNFPIESALVLGRGPGWRAARKGEQLVRIIFDRTRPLRRIKLEFSETEIERTQEFSLRWSAKPGGPFCEIVRQQWTFSPRGATSEVEDYQVNLDSVSTLELAIRPDLTPANAVASLDAWRVA
jgi:hypothetical protein